LALGVAVVHDVVEVERGEVDVDVVISPAISTQRFTKGRRKTLHVVTKLYK
jgi:hypothetical protein